MCRDESESERRENPGRLDEDKLHLWDYLRPDKIPLPLETGAISVDVHSECHNMIKSFHRITLKS